MKIAFRADATPTLGSGHVMRCLTLAHALERRGHIVRFVGVISPPALKAALNLEGAIDLPNCGSQHADALATADGLDGWRPDWIIVDNYDLDARWHRVVRPHVGRILVIDDLANREHDCDTLLDQNLIAGMSRRYRSLVSNAAIQLIGPTYALVRPEFAAHRKMALARRSCSAPERLFVFLGGGDVGFEMLEVLDAVQNGAHRWSHIDCVIGAGCSGAVDIEGLLATLPNGQLHVQTSKIAQVMARSDFAITASGSVSWEKCTLGLPGIGLCLADNQAPIAQALHAAGAQVTSSMEDLGRSLAALVAQDLGPMSAAAASICDASGAQRVVLAMEGDAPSSRFDKTVLAP